MPGFEPERERRTLSRWTKFFLSLLAVLAIAIALFVYTPGEGIELAVLAGVALTLVVGEVVIRFAENHRRHR